VHLATAAATATATAYLLSLATASAPGDGPRNLLTPGNTELGETGGARNFLSLTSCCLCLWRRPAQPGDGPLNAYLLSLATASAPGDGRCDRDRDRVFFIFGDVQRTWRRPAQFVNPR